MSEPLDDRQRKKFYRLAVGFRNSVEAMIHRRPTDPPDEPNDREDDDNLSGSRVPKRPPGGADAVGIALAPPVDTEAETIDVAARPGS
jgi:hypothetical protein